MRTNATGDRKSPVQKERVCHRRLSTTYAIILAVECVFGRRSRRKPRTAFRTDAALASVTGEWRNIHLAPLFVARSGEHS